VNQIFIVALLVSVSLSFVGGWKANSWKHDSDRLLEAEAQQKALLSVAEEIAKIDIKNTTIKQKVVEHVIKDTVYVNCKHDDVGMQLVNEAITGERQPTVNRKLPKTTATDVE
jgi:hypothetical protein